jgi:hypothetical protein
VWTVIFPMREPLYRSLLYIHKYQHTSCQRNDMLSSLESTVFGEHAAQSRQSARLFLQSSELAPPLPRPLASVTPPPLWFRGGGKHSLAEEGVGGSQFGQTRWNCVYVCDCIYLLCGIQLFSHFVLRTASIMLWYYSMLLCERSQKA